MSNSARTLRLYYQRRGEWFRGKRCAICGATDRLELDHIDPATKMSHRLWLWSKARRDAELAKCRVLCHSCHTKRSADQNRTRHERRRGRPVQHGTQPMYCHYGCRCDACREAHRICARDRRQAKAAEN